jgi:hypothetical protein
MNVFFHIPVTKVKPASAWAQPFNRTAREDPRTAVG